MGRYFVALKPIGTMPRVRTQPVVAEWRAGAGAGGRDAPLPCRCATGTAATRNRRVAVGVAGVLGALG